VFRRNLSVFKHLWQQQFCFTIGETGGMKGFQQISQHRPWSKIPQTAQKPLTLAGKVGAVREPPPTAKASLRASYQAAPRRIGRARIGSKQLKYARDLDELTLGDALFGRNDQRLGQIL
jgi:hypothetical protein